MSCGQKQHQQQREQHQTQGSETETLRGMVKSNGITGSGRVAFSRAVPLSTQSEAELRGDLKKGIGARRRSATVPSSPQAALRDAPLKSQLDEAITETDEVSHPMAMITTLESVSKILQGVNTNFLPQSEAQSQVPMPLETNSTSLTSLDRVPAVSVSNDRTRSWNSVHFPLPPGFRSLDACHSAFDVSGSQEVTSARSHDEPPPLAPANHKRAAVSVAPLWREYRHANARGAAVSMAASGTNPDMPSLQPMAVRGGRAAAPLSPPAQSGRSTFVRGGRSAALPQAQAGTNADRPSPQPMVVGCGRVVAPMSPPAQSRGSALSRAACGTNPNMLLPQPKAVGSARAVAPVSPPAQFEGLALSLAARPHLRAAS